MRTIDQHLSLHASAVRIRAARAQTLATNLANADTPGYRAQDINFATTLKNRISHSESESIRSTHPKHLPIKSGELSNLQYTRTAQVESLDGNSVNTEQERMEFVDNEIRYQASLQFLNSKINGLLRALRSE